MLLSDVFYEDKENYEYLKSYTIKIDKVSSILNYVLLENEVNIIKIAIEENEGYASILIEQKLTTFFYYALSDYSNIDGAIDIFDVMDNSINKDDFYREVRNCIKKQKKIGKHNAYQIKLVQLIYDLIGQFLAM